LTKKEYEKNSKISLDTLLPKQASRIRKSSQCLLTWRRLYSRRLPINLNQGPWHSCQDHPIRSIKRSRTKQWVFIHEC